MGYDLSQVVEEYHQIRSVTLELLEETAPPSPPARRIVDDMVGLALCVAATQYAHLTRAELDRVQNHYRLLVENTRDYPFITFDPHGEILTWSWLLCFESCSVVSATSSGPIPPPSCCWKETRWWRVPPRV